MIIKNEPGYIIEHSSAINHGGGSNPMVTRITLHDGLDMVEIYGMHLPCSKIRVHIKTSSDISWREKIRYILNFDLGKIWEMPLEDARVYLYESMEKELKKEMRR